MRVRILSVGLVPWTSFAIKVGFSYIYSMVLIMSGTFINYFTRGVLILVKHLLEQARSAYI